LCDESGHIDIISATRAQILGMGDVEVAENKIDGIAL
jgi:hypothetical protein